MKNEPSPLDEHLGYWLRCLSNQVSASFAERLERCGSSVPQWVTLRVLHDHDSLSLKELSARIGVDQGALSRMIERLLVRGLVSRRANPLSRREIAIALTAKGRQLVPRLAREADENDRAFFRTLTVPQQKAFLATIKTLLAANQTETPQIPLS